MTSTTPSGTVILDDIIPANAPWTGFIGKGHKLRIEDTCGCQSVDTLFYSAADMGERYSSQDTLRGTRLGLSLDGHAHHVELRKPSAHDRQ